MNPLKNPTMAKRDRIPLLNLNPRPSKQPKTQSESDMDLAFMLQTQEAMAASLAIKPSSGCMRLYCKGLVKEEMVRGRKVTLAGAGIAICDGRDNLIFQNWKSLKGCVGGRVLSREAAELQALVEGLNEAINLKFKNVIFFCDDRLLYHYVMNSQLPRTKMVATLVNQVTTLQKKFEYCNLHLVASGDIMFASKFATEAIASQITSPTKTSKAKIIKLPCKICFEDTYIGGMYSIDHCPHMYCLSCMKKHVEVKFQTGMVPQCPHKDCKSKLSISRCKIFLAPKLVDVMIERIKESSIPSTEKVYCPYPKCSALMSKEEVLEYTMTSFVSEGGRKCMNVITISVSSARYLGTII
ncbi:hypothetical protein ABKV19_003959 [Rosa sericea]